MIQRWMQNIMKVNEQILDVLTSDLIRHEGKVNTIYLDSEGYKTFGIGHLIKAGEPEFGLPVGTKVDDERVLEAFRADLVLAIKECEKLFPAIGDYPDEVQSILVNMTFNLGRPRLSKFKKMIKAVEENDWNRAADEMMNSKWYKQVKSRGVELVERMRNVA